MATRTVKIDDFDGKSEGAETVVYGLEGTFYTLDLAPTNRTKLEAALKPFIDKSQEITSKDALKHFSSNGFGEVDPMAVRSWAQANGIAVSDKGRVPENIVAQYHAAKAKAE